MVLKYPVYDCAPWQKHSATRRLPESSLNLRLESNTIGRLRRA